MVYHGDVKNKQTNKKTQAEFVGNCDTSTRPGSATDEQWDPK